MLAKCLFSKLESKPFLFLFLFLFRFLFLLLFLFLFLVLVSGSWFLRHVNPGAKTRRFERKGLSGSRQVIRINSRVQNDAFLIYPNSFGVCVVCVWCVWCVW